MTLSYGYDGHLLGENLDTDFHKITILPTPSTNSKPGQKVMQIHITLVAVVVMVHRDHKVLKVHRVLKGIRVIRAIKV